MARRKYTEDDRARVFVALQVHQGNIKRTARETGIPISTVRMWKVDWERDGGPSVEIVEAAQEQAEKFVEDSQRVRDKILSRIEEVVDSGEVAIKDLKNLATAYGVLSDKINLAKGLATSRTESSRPALGPAEMRELAAGFVEGAMEAARIREQEIVEAEWEQVEVKALPSTNSQEE